MNFQNKFHGEKETEMIVKKAVVGMIKKRIKGEKNIKTWKKVRQNARRGKVFRLVSAMVGIIVAKNYSKFIKQILRLERSGNESEKRGSQYDKKRIKAEKNIKTWKTELQKARRVKFFRLIFAVVRIIVTRIYSAFLRIVKIHIMRRI